MKRVVLAAKQAAYTDQDVLNVIKKGFDEIRSEYKLSPDDLILDDVEIANAGKGLDRITISYTFEGDHYTEDGLHRRSSNLDDYNARTDEGLHYVLTGVELTVRRKVEPRQAQQVADNFRKYMPKLQKYLDSFCDRNGDLDVTAELDASKGRLIVHLYRSSNGYPIYYGFAEERVDDTKYTLYIDTYNGKFETEIYVGLRDGIDYESAVQAIQSKLPKFINTSNYVDEAFDGLPDAVVERGELQDALTVALPDLQIEVSKINMRDYHRNDDNYGVDVVLLHEGVELGNPIEIKDIFSVNTSDIIKKLKAKIRRYQPQPSKRSLMK